MGFELEGTPGTSVALAVEARRTCCWTTGGGVLWEACSRSNSCKRETSVDLFPVLQTASQHIPGASYHGDILEQSALFGLLLEHVYRLIFPVAREEDCRHERASLESVEDGFPEHGGRR